MYRNQSSGHLRIVLILGFLGHLQVHRILIIWILLKLSRCSPYVEESQHRRHKTSIQIENLTDAYLHNMLGLCQGKYTDGYYPAHLLPQKKDSIYSSASRLTQPNKNLFYAQLVYKLFHLAFCVSLNHLDSISCPTAGCLHARQHGVRQHAACPGDMVLCDLHDGKPIQLCKQE